LASAYRIRPVADAAGHFARRWSNRNSATRSSIDADLQALVNNTLRRHLSELGGRNVEDGAVLVLDNRSGEILAYAGSSGDLSAAAAVDGVRAKRQAGSTLKPFLYALALEQRLYTAASIVTDTPLSVPTGAGLYVPQNYERDFKGAVSLRSALGASLNVPAVRVAQSVGVERFYDLLKRLGFDGLTEGADHYGPAIALGSAEVSLWELTNAYRALANGGWWSPPRDTPGSALGGRRSLSRQASFVVADILADRSARALTFGLESALGLPFWAAVKTGTSKDMRDNWAIGFSDRYCIGVWVGNFSGAPMWDVSGVTGAAPIWAELMRALHDARPSRAPKAPTGLVQRPVFFSDAIEPPRREWFLAGTELNNVSAATGQTQILYPSEGSILALDPDIPAANQWVIFSAAGAPTGALWELDGATVAEPRWAPQAGAHQLRLLTSAGRQLAAVNFLVRGTSTDPDFAPLAESP
jgi:penicillin-binding protein 1C